MSNTLINLCLPVSLLVSTIRFSTIKVVSAIVASTKPANQRPSSISELLLIILDTNLRNAFIDFCVRSILLCCHRCGPDTSSTCCSNPDLCGMLILCCCPLLQCSYLVTNSNRFASLAYYSGARIRATLQLSLLLAVPQQTILATV